MLINSCWTPKVVVVDGDVCDLKKLQDKKNIELHFFYLKVLKAWQVM